MVDIQKIATLLTLHHGKVIYYHSLENKWIYFSRIEYLRAEATHNTKILDFMNNAGEYVPLFEYEDRNLLEDIRRYLELRIYIKEMIEEKLTITRFVNLIKNNDELFNDWIMYFIGSISYEVHLWVNDYGLSEIEAPKECYSTIRNLFLKFMDGKFYRYLPDNQLIVLDSYDQGHLVIMGNAGLTYGLSFYLGENASDFFKYQQVFQNTSITDFSLYESFGIYLERNTSNNPFRNKKIFNPYGEDGKVTSIYSNISVQYNCYLPYSVAFKIIYYLNMLNERLPIFIKSNEYKLLDTDQCHEIVLSKSFPYITSFTEENSFPEEYFYNFGNSMFGTIKNANIKANLTYEISLKRATSYIEDKTDKRINQLVYILLIVDRDSKEIVAALMNDEYGDDPILMLYDKFREFLAANPFAKNIYINTFCDFTMVYNFLFDLIENKKIIINAVGDKMLIDECWEKLDNGINKDPDYFEDA